ncbi:hypothetical protein [Streptomyces sp. RFCAC02]|uniref:hypothetical protein n=1 Tax=Streptomyces sp. RFCAC02 TaxID=2499143 RepID=UPI00102070AB|nr:hypothetical protein [Streptomyces sp. RFCAC02]
MSQGQPGYGGAQGGPYGPNAPGQGYGPPAPGPYGQQGGRGGGGKKAVRTIAGVVGVAAIATLTVLAMNDSGGGSDDGGSGESHTLVLPVTSGDFRIAGAAESADDLDPQRLAELGIEDAEGTSGLYYAGITPEEAASLTDLSELNGREVTTLSVFGVWGTVDDPEAAASGLLTFGAQQNGGGGMTLVGDPQDMQPAGIGDAVMKCQYATTTDPATASQVQVPVCAWADDYTVGFTALQRQDASGTVEIPLDVAADHTSTLRTASLAETTTTTEE